MGVLYVVCCVLFCVVRGLRFGVYCPPSVLCCAYNVLYDYIVCIVYCVLCFVVVCVLC